MSELKDRWFWAYPTESVDCDGITGSAHEVYSKSEADKVIADLEDRLHNVSWILKETREWLIESQKLHKRCADNAVKVIRHQKYKRCLNNSEICREKKKTCYKRALRTYNKDKENYLVLKSYFWQDWELLWLKLAAEFKEAK